MKKKAALIIVFLHLFVLTSLAQTAKFKYYEYGIIYTHCKIPYEMEVLSVKHKVGHLYLYAESKYFNKTDLTQLFTCLSKEYPEFTSFDITVYDDRPNLKVAVRQHFFPPPDSNPPDDPPIDCEHPERAGVPCPLGYYRAEYFRFDGREYFDYSVDPKIVPLTRVNMKEK